MINDQIIKKVKQWYWILSGIWITFWVLDVLVLVPLYPEGGIIYNIKSIFEDKTDLAFTYLLITIPIYLFLIIALVKKITNPVIAIIMTRRRAN